MSLPKMHIMSNDEARTADTLFQILKLEELAGIHGKRLTNIYHPITPGNKGRDIMMAAGSPSDPGITQVYVSTTGARLIADGVPASVKYGADDLGQKDPSLSVIYQLNRLTGFQVERDLSTTQSKFPSMAYNIHAPLKELEHKLEDVKQAQARTTRPGF